MQLHISTYDQHRQTGERNKTKMAALLFLWGFLARELKGVQDLRKTFQFLSADYLGWYNCCKEIGGNVMEATTLT